LLTFDQLAAYVSNTIIVRGSGATIWSHADLLDGRLGGRLHHRPRGRAFGSRVIYERYAARSPARL